MSTPLLPKIGLEPKTKVSDYGKWISNSQNTLGTLVNDLATEAAGKINVTSVPDLWAHPKVYEMVLSNEDHPLHEKYVAEWRGVLAILALREMRGLKQIGLQSIDIPEPDSKLAKSGPEFFKVITKMVDSGFKKYKDEHVASGYAYKLQIFTYTKNQRTEFPLAIVWPRILVCPSVSLEHGLEQNPVRWWHNGVVEDPCKALGKKERVCLFYWLQNLQNEVAKYGIEHNVSSDTQVLVKLLNGFIEDLEAECDQETLASSNNYSIGTSLGVTGYCRIVDQPIVIEDDGDFASQSNLRISRNGRNILVVDPSIGQNWGVVNSDIIVGGTVTLEMIINDLKAGRIDRHTLPNKVLREDEAEVWSVKDFFTDKVVVIHNQADNAFPNNMNAKRLSIDYGNGDKAWAILPIRREVLDYLDYDYISDHTKISEDEGNITVELTVTVSGKEIDGKLQNVVRLKKVYEVDKDKIISDYEALPMIQVWPNFVTANPDNWKTYYSFYDRVYVDEGRTFYAEPYWKDASKVELVVANNQVEILRGPSFPTVYTCQHIERLGSGTQSMEIGLLCLAKPNTISDNGSTVKIGIDFGTTNTVAYMANGDGEKDILRFANRLYPVTAYDKASSHDLRRFFLPESEQPDTTKIKDASSIRTIFHDFSTDSEINDEDAFTLGNIYYLEGAQSIGKDRAIIDSVKDDIKWDGSANNIQRITAFLKQYTMQCLAEAVAGGAKRVQWSYSYPKAFTVEQVSNMKSIWVNKDNGLIAFLNHIADISNEEVEAVIESLAMSQFFTDKMRANIKSRGIVCLDIGGGSTDIAIWQDKEHAPRHQCSIRFAGRDILSNYLYNKNKNNNAILKALEGNDVAFNKQLEQLRNAKSKKSFKLELEAILKYHEGNIFRALGINSKDPKMYIVLRDITFALSGIFFYCGTVLADLMKKGTYQNKRYMPHCYVGGNASKLLEWAAKGDYTNSYLSMIFLNCLYYGIASVDKNVLGKGFKPEAEIKKSTLPKQEVAYGLVCDKKEIPDDEKEENTSIISIDIDDIEVIGGVFDDDSFVVAGEIFTKNGEEAEDLELFASDFCNEDLIVEVDENCTRFKQFVKVFNTLIEKTAMYKGCPVKLDKDYTDIMFQVNDELRQKYEIATNPAKSGELELEPIFIMELRDALLRLSER